MQGDEVLEGDGDNFGIFHHAAHEELAKGVFCMPETSVVIKSDSLLAGILYSIGPFGKRPS